MSIDEQVPWWVSDQKKQIKECLGTDGFRSVFAEAVSFAAPIRWDGYAIVRFANPGKIQGSEDDEKLLNELVRSAIRTCELPKKDFLCAAIYFWMWRAHGKGPHFQAGVGALADGEGEHDYYQFPGAGQWSWFYLLYLDSLTWSFPTSFNGTEYEWNEATKSPRFRYVYQEVCRQLCGVRTSTARVFSQRTGMDEEYKRICASTQRACWADRYARIDKTPELVLALSFYANGFASYKTHPHQVNGSIKENADLLYNLIEKATRYDVYVPEDDWEARAVFFILAQWLYLSDRRIGADTLEERIFALLYLRFYRRGVDGYFGRDSLRKTWDAIPFEEKEKTAARFRRMLIDTRNKAATNWPNSIQTEFPEIDSDYYGSHAFNSLFLDAVSSADESMLTALLNESKPCQDTFAQAALWAASHSKAIYDKLMTFADKYDTVHFDDLTDKQIFQIRQGWKSIPIGDLSWSAEALQKMISHKSYELLLNKCSSLIADAIGYDGQPSDLERIEEYVETVGLDPNGPHDDDSGHVYSPLCRAVMNGNEELVEYLLDCGADPNLKPARDTPLNCAIGSGKNDMVVRLLHSGADPHLEDVSGHPPIIVAAVNNNVGAMLLLVEAGINPASIDTSSWKAYAKFWDEAKEAWEKHQQGYNVAILKVNMIPQENISIHYTAEGIWRLDPINDEGYDDVEDYAELHPEYVFMLQNGNTNLPYVGIHDPGFAKSLGKMSYAYAHNGGLVVRVGDTENIAVENDQIGVVK